MTDFAGWFWLVVVGCCLLWYSTITVLVTVRGLIDIRGMLARLRNGEANPDQ